MTASSEHDPAEDGGPPILAARYEITGRIGAGGMGVVYAAYHRELETRVAIKVLQPRLASDPTARARFLREARLAASIEGEHSTRIHDVGADDLGRPYLVMELLAGEALDEKLARDGRLGLRDAATIMMQLLDALAEAHAKGLVHRDLEPGNLFLVTRPGEPVWVKVMDFGVSKLAPAWEAGAEPPSSKLTAPRTVLGSPAYMSPEQLRDAAVVDLRSDLWACGVILFELLTGQMPFEGPSLPDLYARIVSEPPRSLSSAGAPDVAAPVARLVERCLQKDPARRPGSAHDLAVVLAPFASDSARALVPRVRAWCKTEPAPRSPVPPARRALAGLGLVLVSGLGAFALASMRAPPRRIADVRSPMVLPLRPPPAPSSAASTVTVAAPLPRSAPSAAPPVTTAERTGPRPGASAARPAPSATARKNPPSERIQDLDGIELIR